MQSAREAIQAFVASRHILQVLDGDWMPMFSELGQELDGIRGRTGAAEITADGQEIGVDMIEMQPGTLFPLHIHPGDHILFVLPDSSEGIVAIDGIDHSVKPGETIFIPAAYPHGIKTQADAKLPLRFLAFGHPHKHISAHDRMHVLGENP